MIHEPLTHCRPGERCEILAAGRVGCWRSDDDCVRHCAVLFEDSDNTGNAGLLLAYGDVDAIERTVGFVASLFGSSIEPSLADDGVDTDRGLSSRPVTDNQFALASTYGDHGIDCHNASLNGLPDRAPPDDAGSDLFDGIEFLAVYRCLSIE